MRTASIDLVLDSNQGKSISLLPFMPLHLGSDIGNKMNCWACRQIWYLHIWWEMRSISTFMTFGNPGFGVNSRRHGIRKIRIRVLLYGFSVPLVNEFSAKHFQNFFFGAQLVLSFWRYVIFRRCYNLVIKRETHVAPRWSFLILLFCLVFFDNEAF